LRSAAGICLAALLLASGCTHAAPTTSPAATTHAERSLAADLDAIFGARVMAQALWGVEVKSLDTGRVLYARNARTLMMPASNMKILTLAAAAEALGWDYRFTTTFETSATIDGGVLLGDLIVRGGGDPTINTRDLRAAAFFDRVAAGLEAAGITRIDGNVVGDDRAFDNRRLGQGWSWDYLQYGYAAPVGALEFNEDVATLTIRPSAPGEDAGLELPPGTGLGLVHHVITGPPGSPTRIEVERQPGTNWLDVSGTVAADAAPVQREVAVLNPTLYFAHSLLNALTARGIRVRGLPVEFQQPKTLVAEPATRTLVVAQSPPLREIAATMMKVSQNLYAETLLKAIGAATSDMPGSTEGGLAAARGVFAAWQIQPGTYVQVDGSGLSRYDFVTPETLITILERLYKDPRHRDAFTATLPVAGKDGTISTRLRATRAEANATAKTGSIANVRALSGYVRTRDGETLAFSMLANNFTIAPATVNWMADLAVETLANYKR